MPNIDAIIRDHVTLSVGCIDRIYVNGYVPGLQTSGGLCYFLQVHRGKPIPSPVLFEPMRERFVGEIRRFADRYRVPLITFKQGERKDDVVADYRARFRKSQGVVVIGVAQEKASSFKATKRRTPRGSVTFDFSRHNVAVNHYYFYVLDPEWGPAFIKIGSYFPYPVKLCLNGHEWVKQRLRAQHVPFESLDNGFLTCADPARLQKICDHLGPAHLQHFFDRWSHSVPWPLLPSDRRAGYEHRLSLWQLEVSLTQVFDCPVQGRHFFEEVIRENLDLGRPDRVRLLFPFRKNSRTPPPRFGYRTRVITDGVDPSLHVEFKRCHVKQYFKENRALRTETTINDPTDLHVNKSIDNLDHLRRIGHQVNRRMLEIERVSQNCTLTQEGFDHLQKPALVDGQRVPGLRFGDTRLMALLHGLCLFAHLPRGFRNIDLRRQVAALLGISLDAYTRGKMTYDLRRLRRRGLITRIPKTNRYLVTTYGIKVALFYSKVFLRILRPGWTAVIDLPDPIPRTLRNALRRVTSEIQRLHDRANLEHAA